MKLLTKLIAKLKRVWQRYCAAALNWLCDCFDLTRKELYDKAIRDSKHYYRLWQIECDYVKDLYIRRDVYEAALKHACATGGDLCVYCTHDWTTCGHDFSCNCEHFSFNSKSGDSKI